MTALPFAGPASASRSLDPVGDVLTALSAELHVHCLVEDRLGRLVAHALRAAPPPAVADAVLRRDASLLHAAAAARRTATLLPAGPVQTMRVGRSAHARVVPLSAGVEALGWLWLVSERPLPEDAGTPERVADLERVLVDVTGAAYDADVAAILAGRGVLPDRLRGLPLHVAVVQAIPPRVVGVASALQCAAGRRPARGQVVLAVDTSGGADLLVAGVPDPVWEAVGRWCAGAAELLGVELAAGLSEPADCVSELPGRRQQAATVVRVAGRAGTCVPVAAARSAVVLEHVGTALDSLPPLGRDPLADLLEYDTRRSSGLARSLLAWLDAHGDVPLAADVLRVHQNTLRYRIARAINILDADVTDPAVRLEIHLRLRRRARPPGRAMPAGSLPERDAAASPSAEATKALTGR